MGLAHGLPWLSPPLRAIYHWLSAWDLSWTQELCIYMFIWMAKFGAAYGVRTGIHVGVDVFVARMAPERAKKVILFGLFCGALFTGMIAAFGAHFVYGIYLAGHGLQRHRSADVDRLPGDPARLLADVLPLPAGRLAFLPQRRAAAPRHRPCRGGRGIAIRRDGAAGGRPAARAARS